MATQKLTSHGASAPLHLSAGDMGTKAMGPSRPFGPAPNWLVAGGVWIVAGGSAAAVTGPTRWEQGSWVAAFLVLVAGVAQIGLGAGARELTAAACSGRWSRAQAALWNGGCATVVAATLLSNPAAVSLGGVLLATALLRAAVATRRSVSRSHLLVAYRTLIIGVLASIPVGLALSWFRH